MDVEGQNKGQKRQRKAIVYNKGPIPYITPYPLPKTFWKIKKGLSADQYWKKRYWRRRITGKGDYTMDYRKRSTGANWGGYLGSKAGEFLGGAAQKLFGHITGLGDYSVKRNVFAHGRLPQIVNNPDGGGIVIRFQEYLGDIITGTLFSSVVFFMFCIRQYT